MPVTHADLITILQCEALFVECGGYRSAPFPWRSALLIEDGPSCARGDTGHCSGHSCPWLAFVAPKYQGEETPCRQIVVGKHGETIELLYRTATPEECEESFHAWLLAAIERFERLAAQVDEEERRGHMDFVCKGCGKRKGPGDEWLLVLEFEKPGTNIRNMVILAEWDDKQALNPRAVHFCSVACQQAFVAKHYARELVA